MKGPRPLALVPALAVCLILALLVVPPVSLATTLPHAIVESVHATPSALPSGGGQVQVTGTVEHSSSCQLQLLSSQPFAVVFSHNPTTECRDGHYSSHVTIGTNLSRASRTVLFALVARNGSSSFTGGFEVVLAAPVPPAVLSVSASPGALGPQGGPVTVRGKVSHASSCALELLSKQSFPVVYSANSRPCTSGFTAHVIIGPNPSTVHRTVAFALVARSNGMAFTSRFYVGLASWPPPTTLPAATTTLPPAATTTLPPAATTTTVAGVSTQQQTDSNWSGYAVTGGPYTSVSGTFTLSTLTDGTPPSGLMDEWVGIDGLAGSPGYPDLIQAGIMESMLPCEGSTTEPNGAYNPDEFWMCPWTTFIENGQLTEGPVPDISLSEGDSVTVEIYQQNGTAWAISMDDITNGQNWSVGDQYYAGPGSSAEWIVEAPGVVGQGCGVVVSGEDGQCPLAPYSPPVAFSNLLLAPAAVTTWYEITMVQDGAQVSTPSLLSTSGTRVLGFSVSYTGTNPSGREGADRVADPVVKDLPTPVLEKTVERDVGALNRKERPQ